MVIDAGALSAMTVVWGLGDLAERERVVQRLPDRKRERRRSPVRQCDRGDVRVGVQCVEVLSNVKRRVGDGEPANDLVERRLIGQERRRRDNDRAVGRGDRGDLARIGGQRRQPRFNIRSRIVDREQHGRGVGILQLADRGRIGGQLLNRSGDLAVVQNRNDIDVGIVELIEVCGNGARRVENVEAARRLVERRLIGQERRHRDDERPTGINCHGRVCVARARADAGRVGQSECRRPGARGWGVNKGVELAGDRRRSPRKDVDAWPTGPEPVETRAVGQGAAEARQLDRDTV